jgi:hypothetical protein
MWTVNAITLFGAQCLRPWVIEEVNYWRGRTSDMKEAEKIKFMIKWIEDSNRYDPLIKHMLKHEIAPHEYCMGAKYWESCGICHLLGK